MSAAEWLDRVDALVTETTQRRAINRIGPAHPDHPDHADRPCCGRRHELDQLRADVRALADDLDAQGHHDLADRLRTQTYIPGEGV